MEHTMGLYEEHLNNIKNGGKTIEVRLNDEKRRKIEAGDTIRFIKVPRDGESITTEVMGLEVFTTFKEMYENVSAEEIGSRGDTIEEMVNDTYEIYTPEQEKKYGTLAIRIEYAD